MTGSISLVGSLFQEELPCFAADPEQERTRRRVQHALLHLSEFDLQDFIKLRALQRMEHDHLIYRFINSGENFRLAASTAVLSTFSGNPVTALSFGWMNPMPPCIRSAISLLPRLEVRKITVCDKSTLRLSPKVNVALSSIPSSSCHSASLAFSISSNSKKLSFSSPRWLAAYASCVMSGRLSGWRGYPVGEPINFAISGEC